MQRITLFTFCLQYIGFEFLDFAGKFDILSFLLKSSQNMIYLDCDNDTDHDHSVWPQPPRRLKEFSLNQEY